MKRLEKLVREELLKPGKKGEENEVCLSLFVPEGEPRRQLNDLKELIVEAADFLKGVYKSPEMEVFLRPLAKINQSHLARHKGALGIFRAMEGLKIVEIPIEVEKECFVSNHFHIKPLLAWLQEDTDFLCVEFSKSGAKAHKGDSLGIEEVGRCPAMDAEKIDEILFGSSEDGADTVVYLAGNLDLARRFCSNTKHPRIEPSAVARDVYRGELVQLQKILLERTRQRALAKVKKSLRDFNLALLSGLAESDVENIVRAAKNGMIKKLIVSKDEKIWGRFDAYRNNVNRINKQTNYEDDDLLDSISEKVLQEGGEVVVAGKKQLPKGMPMLAILKNTAA